tara:strand:- start:2023 stop:3276 length:1254 start_codon:yes stop_codon:yes gene_type:complete
MNIFKKVEEICQKSKIASKKISLVNSYEKNKGLEILSKNILSSYEEILIENKKDLEKAKKNSLSSSLINRLTLTSKSLDSIVKSINEIAKQPNPVGNIIEEWTQPNGLRFEKVSTPIGVIGIIYESRPNVTIDATCIALKSGNTVILRGGSDSYYSSNKLVEIMVKSFLEAELPQNIVQMIPTIEREAVDHLIQMKEYVDIIIPRGGKSLIEKINSQSKIPVIKHLDGICHLYIDKEANLEKAKKVIFNSKLRRPEICGATETLLIDEQLKDSVLNLLQPLVDSKCEIRGDSYITSLNKNFLKASEKDWQTEYLDKILSVKIVNDLDSAIKHINKYSSGHTEAIITENKSTFKKFYENIDSAIILQNASTQFADGGEFGFGAEIGISTDKLHVRGPVGAKHLTSFKYIVHGNGHERP